MIHARKPVTEQLCVGEDSSRLILEALKARNCKHMNARESLGIACLTGVSMRTISATKALKRSTVCRHGYFKALERTSIVAHEVRSFSPQPEEDRISGFIHDFAISSIFTSFVIFFQGVPG
jgi:hypothetical protein